jgi:importin-5
VPIVNNMVAICETATLEEGTRQLAAEFLTTLCEAREKAPGMMRKLPDFIGRLFACLMNFLLDCEDDPLWHAGDRDEDEGAGEGELFESGQEYLDRVAISLGGNSMMPIVAAFLPAWLADADW